MTTCLGTKISRWMSPEQRFAEQHIREPNSGCWLWIGSLNKCRYGLFQVDGRQGLAHRHSYEMHIGKIPDGLCVLHKCDTPECVNPDHLFLGTQQDNIADMNAKDRQTRKLDAQQVRGIRASAGSLRSIGEKFGISVEQVRNVRSRRDWAHVT